MELVFIIFLGNVFTQDPFDKTRLIRSASRLSMDRTGANLGN
jgi:hypothetical protein